MINILVSLKIEWSVLLIEIILNININNYNIKINKILLNTILLIYLFYPLKMS